MTVHQTICLSIVSHGQGHLIKSLLGDLQRLQLLDPAKDQIVLTLNIPEDEMFFKGFGSLPLIVLRNTTPKGFGANHNAAFKASQSDIFVVVNPDIRLRSFDTKPLLEVLSSTDAGLWAPRVLASSGEVEDNARRFPTFLRLGKRIVLRQRSSDYTIKERPVAVDWVAGMFMALRRDTYAAAGGFDERYFMYMEDADLCRRITQLGMRVIVDPRVDVIHDAQRASRRSLRHLRWHCRSAGRFLFGI
jgi:N-acetylglucosaminyl-diphospho-decaprenol L-rhamnosyltransferase